MLIIQYYYGTENKTKKQCLNVHPQPFLSGDSMQNLAGQNQVRETLWTGRSHAELRPTHTLVAS